MCRGEPPPICLGPLLFWAHPIRKHGNSRMPAALNWPTGWQAGYAGHAPASDYHCLHITSSNRHTGDTACVFCGPGRLKAGCLGCPDYYSLNEHMLDNLDLPCLDNFTVLFPYQSCARAVIHTNIDISSGEQTATALEANLTSLESKLDQLLASFEQGSADADAVSSPVANGDEKGGAEEKGTADK